MLPKKNTIFRLLFVCIFTFAVISTSINLLIVQKTAKLIFIEPKDLPGVYTVIVPGAFVKPNGTLSLTLGDRVDKALELYKLGKVKRFLLSGDHGQKNYDEVNNMKKYLLDKGVPTEDIFLDHAGFNTYNTMIRAKKIFEIDKAIIVTQKFHLPRAVYIARTNGIEAYGYVADKRKYDAWVLNQIREFLARTKSFFEIMFNVSPKFLGEKIPITGDSSKSYDDE